MDCSGAPGSAPSGTPAAARRGPAPTPRRHKGQGSTLHHRGCPARPAVGQPLARRAGWTAAFYGGSLNSLRRVLVEIWTIKQSRLSPCPATLAPPAQRRGGLHAATRGPPHGLPASAASTAPRGGSGAVRGARDHPPAQLRPFDSRGCAGYDRRRSASGSLTFAAHLAATGWGAHRVSLSEGPSSFTRCSTRPGLA